VHAHAVWWAIIGRSAYSLLPVDRGIARCMRTEEVFSRGVSRNACTDGASASCAATRSNCVSLIGRHDFRPAGSRPAAGHRRRDVRVSASAIQRRKLLTLHLRVLAHPVPVDCVHRWVSVRRRFIVRMGIHRRAALATERYVAGVVEVLVSKEHHAPLTERGADRVPLRVAQGLAQIETSEFRSDRRRCRSDYDMLCDRTGGLRRSSLLDPAGSCG
jgi:hypothetical protein